MLRVDVVRFVIILAVLLPGFSLAFRCPPLVCCCHALHCLVLQLVFTWPPPLCSLCVPQYAAALREARRRSDGVLCEWCSRQCSFQCLDAAAADGERQLVASGRGRPPDSASLLGLSLFGAHLGTKPPHCNAKQVCVGVCMCGRVCGRVCVWSCGVCPRHGTLLTCFVLCAVLGVPLSMQHVPKDPIIFQARVGTTPCSLHSEEGGSDFQSSRPH